MSTLIENVNDIVLIKEDLDALLNEYGVDGGEQFDTYPEKFRELFRLIQDSTVIAVDTLYQEVDTVTIVADPVIWQSDNIIQITCATVDAVIYYRMVGLDTGTDWGETEYKNKFYISENAHIEAYAMDKNKQYRSGTVWINAEYVLGNVPEKPIINRDRTTGDVTMTCATDGASIYFRNGGSDWTLYVGEVYIPLADDIYAYSVKDGVASDIVFDEGLDDTVRPAIPVISYSNNTITITDATEAANIYYRERLSDTWILYEGPVEISESGWYVAIAYKDGVYSEQTDPPLFCEYVSPIPAVPEISCENNTVTITCDTLGATIYFKDEDSDIWLVYSGPFTISETVTIESKSFKNGYYSDVVSVECEYDDSGSGGGGDTPSYQKPEKPEMSLYYNTVTITCATEGATIYWMYLLDNEWIEYEGPFQISKSGYYVSKAVKNDIESDLSDVAYFEWDSEIDYIVPAIPVIDYEANTITITCSTDGADIYYRLDDGSWIAYDGPITITESVTVYAYSEKDGVESDISDGLFCEFYSTPAAPTIYCTENLVSISSTDGGTIYYRVSGDTDWIEYLIPFLINESNYYQAIVIKNGISSDITTTLCEYSADSTESEWYSYREIPLTVTALEDGVMNITFKTGIYKVNGDITFNKVENETVVNTSGWTIIRTPRKISINVTSGDKIYLLSSDGIKLTDNTNNVRHSISGNVLSICYGQGFMNHLNDSITKPMNIYDDKKLIHSQNLVLPYSFEGGITLAGMFEYCSELISAPYILPAVTLIADAYNSMFKDCSSLTSAPIILAHTLAYNCCSDMFLRCTSLTTAPALPATTLAQQCYQFMFSLCTNLVNAPALPATTLAVGCYNAMFNECTSLTTAPALPATTLAVSCYNRMFFGCSSLIAAPYLPATTLVSNCYQEMFRNCSSLNYINCNAVNGIVDSFPGPTGAWVYDVASTGTFIQNESATWPIGGNGIPTGWDGEEPVEEFEYLTFEVITGGKITFSYGITTTTSNSLRYSLNGGGWNIFDANAEGGLSVSSGDIVRFKANNLTYSVVGQYGVTSLSTFGVSNGCTYNVKGHISSLINNDAEEQYTLSSSNAGAFAGLFENNTGLIDASELILCDGTAEYCYYYMFKGCTNLINTPAIPATTLSNACYSNMFEGCTSLTSAPTLPATELSSSCYASMFKGCTSLTSAPRLMASVLADRCYTSMFYGCSSLSYIECYAPSLDGYTYPTLDWVYGVAAGGIFKKLSGAVWATGKNGIPSGWTVQEV